ncbi:hypothetical protein GQR58_007210 [Nymphon striatum]|nr:hypothetical protein GQR58_007210 [Nymphon striatum]
MNKPTGISPPSLSPSPQSSAGWKTLQERTNRQTVVSYRVQRPRTSPVSPGRFLAGFTTFQLGYSADDCKNSLYNDDSENTIALQVHQSMADWNVILVLLKGVPTVYITKWELVEISTYDGIVDVIEAVVSCVVFITIATVLRGRDELLGILATGIGYFILGVGIYVWMFYVGLYNFFYIVAQTFK